MALGERSEAETSLRDDLAAGLKAIEEASAAPEPGDEGAQTPEAKPDAEATEAKADRGDGRDAHGRFISKSGSPEGEGASPEKDQKTAAPKDTTIDPQGASQSGQTTVESAQLPPQEDQPPKSWRSDEAQAWKDLPAIARTAILRREADAAKLAGANDAERMFGREMADIFRPHIQEIQAAGASPQIAVKVLLDNHNALRSNDPQVKIAKARELMAQYGIEPSSLIDPNAPQDPYVRALQQQVQQLQAQVNRPQTNQQFAPLPPAQEEVTIASTIEAFRADPAHPHFDAVGPKMGLLLEAGAAPDLETAYKMAVAADPALSSTPVIQTAAANSQEKTAAARRASASVTGSPGPTGNPAPMSLRSELEENARRLGFM